MLRRKSDSLQNIPEIEKIPLNGTGNKDSSRLSRHSSHSPRSEISQIERADSDVHTSSVYMEEVNFKSAQTQVLDFLNNSYVVCLGMLMTFYALYGEDFRLWLFDPSADLGFLVFHYVAIAYFFLELSASYFSEVEYRMSVWMWLDLAALLSMVVDVFPMMDNNNFRAARVAKVATRVGRLLRALRFVSSAKIWNSSKDDMDNPRKQQRHEDKSRFGQYLTKGVTKKLMGVVLAIVMVLPFMEVVFDDSTDGMLKLAVHNLNKCYDVSDSTLCSLDGEKESYLKRWMYHQGPNLAFQTFPEDSSVYGFRKENEYRWRLTKLSIRVGEIRTSFTINNFDIIRKAMIQTVDSKSSDVRIKAWFEDKQHPVLSDPSFRMMQTTMLILILVVGASLMHEDTEKHVINPVQELLEAVLALADDPFYTLKKEDSAIKQESQRTPSRKSSTKIRYFAEDPEDSGEQEADVKAEFEVEVLHTTIRDISQLLAIGFGRAGWNIVRSAILNAGSVDELLLPGKPITGVFMFAQIRHFETLTECLQEDILEFVNTVAEIVHTYTFQNKGATNKNIGDCFLSVWKFPNKVTVNSRLIKVNEIESTFNRVAPLELQYLVDRSFICVVKIVLALLKSEKLADYYNLEAFKERVGEVKRKMGFGLHVGWAIEGAVGSRHKVDATYLSPNVNISARLETATKQYGVFVLLSGQFVNLLCRSASRLLRPVDVVQVKGSKQKVELFTIDFPLNTDEFKSTSDVKVETTLSQLDQIYKWRHSFPCSTREFRTDPDLVVLKNYQTSMKKFHDEYAEGFTLYRRGDWKRAHTWLSKALDLKPDDGPTLELLRVIKESNFKPSPTFVTKGRSLTRK